MENRAGADLILNREGLIRTLLMVPNRLLDAKGRFLGDESDKRIKTVVILRSVCGLVILATVAFAYPGYTTPMSELVTTNGNTPADVVSTLKLADSSLTTALYGFEIFLLCIFVFAVPITILTRSGNRLAMLRHMCIPLIAFVLFAGLMGLIVGTADLLNLMGNALSASSSDLHHAGSLVIAAVELIILIILFLTMVPILAVWYVKAIYLAAVDVFRADDAHPLLAPFATTVVSWALAGIGWLAGGPTGVPHSLRWLLILGGPTGVSAINIWACRRLWQKHHDVLFRNGPAGPRQRMPRTAASPLAGGAVQSRREVIIVSAGIAVLGPLTAILVIFGVHLSATPDSPSGAQPPAGSLHLYSSGSYGFSSPDSIAVDGTYIWVANLGGSVTELNADNGSLVRTLSNSSYGFSSPEGIAVDGTHVWVTNLGGGANGNGSMTELNASNGSLVRILSSASYSFNGPWGIAVDGTHVWVTNYGHPGIGHSITELNASNGSLVRTLYGFKYPSSVAVEGSHVWVANGDSVAELNADNGSLVRTLSNSSYGFNGTQAIAVDGTHVWAANYGGGVGGNGSVTEVNASNGSLVQILSDASYSFDNPQAIATDGTHVWVAANGDSVTELNASNGSLMQILSSASYGFNTPWAIAVDGTHVWVANHGGNSVTEFPTG
jgi:hypothetical protein